MLPYLWFALATDVRRKTAIAAAAILKATLIHSAFGIKYSIFVYWMARQLQTIYTFVLIYKVECLYASLFVCYRLTRLLNCLSHNDAYSESAPSQECFGYIGCSRFGLLALLVC